MCGSVWNEQCMVMGLCVVGKRRVYNIVPLLGRLYSDGLLMNWRGEFWWGAAKLKLMVNCFLTNAVWFRAIYLLLQQRCTNVVTKHV